MARGVAWTVAGLVLLACVPTVSAAVQTKTVTYKAGDVSCQGYLAYDDAISGPRPGVLVVHEWWGLDDYAKRRCRELAELGYVAFAADMYGEGKTVTHPRDAGEMAGKVRSNVQVWRQRAEAALQVLKSQPQTDASRLAAIGYCFGGATALQLAYTGADLKAVSTFHGALPAPSTDEARAIKAELLICHGADDTFIPAEAIKAFRGALDGAKVTYDFVAYPDTVHSFTVPNAEAHGVPGLKYNAESDKDSWKRMQALFQRQLK